MQPQSLANMVLGERQKPLQQLTFAESSILVRELPKAVLKHVLIRLSGSVVTTFASGTPVADALSTMDNLVPEIAVKVDGGGTVKSVRPHLLHMQQLLCTGTQAERASSAGAAAAVDNFPTASGGFAYGTTTQISSVRESVLLSFENVYARIGKEETWLDLRPRSSGELQLKTAAFSSLLGYGNTAPVVYSSSTFVFDLITVEAQGVPMGYGFKIWRQTTKEITFSAQTTDYPIEINKGNRLQAIALLTRDGLAGTTTTASGKMLNNKVVTDLRLDVDGQTIKRTNFKALQAENRHRFGINADFASNVSRFDGFGLLDFLSDDDRGDLNTALDLRPGVASQCQLYVSTNAAASMASGSPYAIPASVVLETQEIIDLNA